MNYSEISHTHCFDNNMRERIMKALTGYGREEGIAFLSKKDAVKYWRGLVELVEQLINKEIKRYEKENK